MGRRELLSFPQGTVESEAQWEAFLRLGVTDCLPFRTPSAVLGPQAKEPGR